MALQFRRGTAADVTSETFVPAIGEPVYITDEDKLYIGDGATIGGNVVGSGATSLSELSDLHLSNQNTATVQSFSISSNTVTLNTVDAHSFVVGRQVTIAGSSDSILNGTHSVVSTPTANSFLFVVTSADVASTVSDGSITAVIPEQAVLAYNTTNSRFEDTKTVDILGRLKNHSDVSTYDSGSDAFSNNDTGKIIRYDYDNEFKIKRTGESIDYGEGAHFLGIDFSNGVTGSVYTANSSNWSEGTGSNSLNSTANSAIQRVPYGNGIEDDGSYNLVNTSVIADSNDFTLDFWLLRDTNDDWVGMVFEDSSSNEIFDVEYTGSTLRLRCNILADGTITASLLHDVISWSTQDLDDEWVHVCIIRKGTDFRAWLNGQNYGAGTLQGSYATDFNFKFSRIAQFFPTTYRTLENFIGPLFFDFKKAWRDPIAANITVPTKPVDFYNLKSGVNIAELNDVNEFETFVNGDILTYYEGIFHPSKPYYSKFKFSLSSAPTGVVSGSSVIGQGTSGFWRPLNKEQDFLNNNEGPITSDFDPIFDAQELLGSFTMPVDGVYHVIANLTFAMDNLSANTYYTNEVTLSADNTGRTNNDRPYHLTFTTHATAPASIIRQTATIQTIERLVGGSSSVNIYLDTDQSDQFYVEEAYITFHKIG